MLRWRMRIRKIAYIFVDIISLMLAFILSDIAFEGFTESHLKISVFEQLAFVMLFVMVYVMVCLVLNLYECTIENYGNLNKRIISKMIVSLFSAAIFMAAILFFLKVDMSRSFLIFYVFQLFLLLILNRMVIRKFIGGRKVVKSNRKILIIGHSSRGYAYIEEIKKHDYLNLEIIGYVYIKEEKLYHNIETLGSIDDLHRIVMEYVVDEIAVARSLSYDERLSDALAECQQMGVTVTMLLETKNQSSHAQVAMVGDLPVLKFHTVSLNETQIFLKRVIDVIGSTIGMVFFGIAFVILYPIIKIESPGPVIFKQNRVGKNGRVFQVWKFRSMGINAEAQQAALMGANEMTGHMFKMSNDPRVTRVGAFIRRTSIDELPQFYNVLRGDMSLVGTRPPTVNEVREYESHHRKRISITPGITGMWQVSGRNDIENFEEVVRMDTEYIKNWSVFMDIKILLKTIQVVLIQRGSR